MKSLLFIYEHKETRRADLSTAYPLLQLRYRGLFLSGQPPGSRAISLPTVEAETAIPPVSRRRLSQRLMVGTETEKVLAASSLLVPRSTAASTLLLRSFE